MSFGAMFGESHTSPDDDDVDDVMNAYGDAILLVKANQRTYDSPYLGRNPTIKHTIEVMRYMKLAEDALTSARKTPEDDRMRRLRHLARSLSFSAAAASMMASLK